MLAGRMFTQKKKSANLISVNATEQCVIHVHHILHRKTFTKTRYIKKVSAIVTRMVKFCITVIDAKSLPL